MYNPLLKLYTVFTAAFLVLHFAGLQVMHLPYILNALIVCSAMLLVLLIAGRWVYGYSAAATMHTVGLRKTGFQNMVPGLIITAVLIGMYPLLGYVLHARISLAANWQWNMIGLFLTGGIAEEILFRGFLFGGLRRTMRFKKAVLVSALLFTLVHLLLFLYFSWPVALLSTLLAAGLSLPFAYLYEKAEHTIWSAALVHAAIRTVGLVITTTGDEFPKLSAAWILVSLIIPYLVLLFYRSFRNLFSNKPN